jgi:hypothetical protein
MTRAMVVTVLYRLAGEPDVSGTSTFSDVSANTWYTKAVAWAQEQGIAEGYPDGTFRVDQPVKRQELVSLLYRYAQRTGNAEATTGNPLSSYADAAQVPAWATDAFSWAIETGLVNGTEGNRLAPQGQALRCQGAVLFQRYCQIFG